MVNRQDVVDYYSRKDISGEIAKNAAGREVAGAFMDGSYDARPNIIQYPSDVVQMAQKGITSFHYSVELWKNPMAITSENYANLRAGWDLLIDIDSKIGMDGAKAAAAKVCEFLGKYGIRNYGIKFSGSRGFHICLPSRMFPKEIDYKPIEKLYPEAPRILAEFIREKISDSLMKELLSQRQAKELLSLLDESPPQMSPYLFVEIEKGWGNRHMFRAPYSFNEKTWLVSVPLNFSRLSRFSADDAKPENVSVNEPFFSGEENEAESLLLAAWDWNAARNKEVAKKGKPPAQAYEGRIPEELFPPCMKLLLAGLRDGRKRSIFTLINFLRIMNWGWEEIRQKVMEWNSRNQPPLPTSIVLGQLRWAEHNMRNPSNCPPDGDLFYVSTGLCNPDEICKNFTDKIAIKNPVSYPFRRMRRTRTERKYETKLYSCLGCDKKFENIKSLRIHQSRMHGISG